MSLEKDSAPLWTTTADGQVKLRRDPTCSQAPITIHQMFLESLEKYKSLNALASKKDGKWEKITFSEYYHLSRKAAKGFLKLGLERFHSVAILGFNSTEWFISAVGAVFAGGIVSGIYTTSSPEACHYIAHDCRANIVVVENQKQLDKIMQAHWQNQIFSAFRKSIRVGGMMFQREGAITEKALHLDPTRCISLGDGTHSIPCLLALMGQIWDRLPHLKAVVMYKDRVSEKHPNLYTDSIVVMEKGFLPRGVDTSRFVILTKLIPSSFEVLMDVLPVARVLLVGQLIHQPQMDEFMELGNDIPDGQLDAIINSQEANQCCVLIYTSGTTGKPKGVMLSHDNITWTSAHASRAGGVQPAEIQQEKIVSYLPLSHVAGQMYDLWTGIKWGEEVYFAQPDALKGSLVEVLREALPSSQMGVPRVWEKMMEKIKEVSSQTGLLKRKMLSWAMSATLEQNLNCSNRDSKPFWMGLVDSLLLANIRWALGLSQCQKHFSGAAPLPVEVSHFFLGLNIPIYEGYGMSETSGPFCIAGPNVYRPHSCGKVVPGCLLKIVNEDQDGNGEICFWGRSVFLGYLNMEDKTREVIDQDGWLHSGDLGKIDQDGFVYVTGRIKELIITAGGENIPPIPLEEAVRKELPLISNAVLIGDRKKFLSMLLTLKCSVDPDTSEPTDCLTQEARDFCQKAGSKATRVSEIVQTRDRAVYRAVEDGLDRVNRRSVSNPQRIQKWAILGKDFSISGGEFGPSMKLKRQTVAEKYQNEIEAFYKD